VSFWRDDSAGVGSSVHAGTATFVLH